MNVSYDTVARATYVRLSTAEVASTIEVSDLASVDVDADGFPVGVELLALPRDITEDHVLPVVDRFHSLEFLLKSEAWLFNHA